MSLEERKHLAEGISTLFEQWKLDADDRLCLLGLSEDNQAALRRYASGSPLANDRDLQARVRHLLGIHRSLWLLFPENPGYRYGWMTMKNGYFDDHRPVDIVRQHGFEGLVILRAHLDALLEE